MTVFALISMSALPTLKHSAIWRMVKVAVLAFRAFTLHVKPASFSVFLT